MGCIAPYAVRTATRFAHNIRWHYWRGTRRICIVHVWKKRFQTTFLKPSNFMITIKFLHNAHRTGFALDWQKKHRKKSVLIFAHGHVASIKISLWSIFKCRNVVLIPSECSWWKGVNRKCWICLSLPNKIKTIKEIHSNFKFCNYKQKSDNEYRMWAR